MSQSLDPASAAAVQAAVSGQDPVAASNAVNDANAPESINTELNQGGDSVDIDQERARLQAEEMAPEAESQEALTEEEAVEEVDGDSEEGELPDTETVFVKGANGRKQKLEINYSDREAVKKAYLRAAGMQKAYKERDAAIAELKGLKEGDQAEKVSNWDYLEQAFQEDGFRGVINAIEGDDNAFASVMQQYVQEQRQWDSMTPEQQEQYQLKRDQARKDTELEAMRQEMEEFKSSVKEERERAEIKDLESTVSSAFDAYSFDGALGDPAKETMLNKMLWAAGREALAAYPDDVPLTQALARREFRKQAKVIQEMVKTEGTKQAARSVEKKKKKAAETIQKQVRKGNTQASYDDQFNDALAKGDMKSLVKTWWKAQHRK